MRNSSNIIVFGLVALIAAGIFIALSAGGEAGLVILPGILLLLYSGIVAYRYPILTIVLVFALGEVLDQELSGFFPPALQNPSVGFMHVRYFDPVLFGMIMAIGLAALKGNRRFGDLVSRHFPITLLFMAWLAIEVLRSIGEYGINTLGEFRTYYHFIFLVPYVVIFFRTEDEQWRLFKVLLATSFLFIPIALLRAALLSDFSLADHGKWLQVFGNLALLYGVFALFLAARRNLIRLSVPWQAVLVVAAATLTLGNGYRSVWLAGVVGIATLVLMRAVSVRNAFGVLILGASTFMVFSYLLAGEGLDTGAFFGSRLLAFTDSGADPSTNWRLQLWADAIDQIRNNPLVGFGLGYHFRLVDFTTGKDIFTSPHNLYLMIMFQLGAVGLALFLSLLAHSIVRLIRLYRTEMPARSQTMTLMALLALVSGAAFGVAYPFDLYSWLYGSLGISVLVTRLAHNPRRRLG